MKKHGTALFRAQVDAPVAERTVILLHDPSLYELQVMGGAAFYAQAAADTAFIGQKGASALLLNLGPGDILHLAQKGRKPVPAPLFDNALLKAGTHPVQSLQGFWWLLEPLLLPYREEGKITDVIGHQEMLCVNHPVLAAGQQSCKGPGSVS